MPTSNTSRHRPVRARLPINPHLGQGVRSEGWAASHDDVEKILCVQAARLAAGCEAKPFAVCLIQLWDPLRVRQGDGERWPDLFPSGDERVVIVFLRLV